ncbi:MAG: CAAD domain-containing protein [Prochloraceae cyanobacterium]
MSSSTPEEQKLDKNPEVTSVDIEPSKSSEKQFLQFGDKISGTIQELLDLVGKFWNAYQLPLLIVGIVVGVAIFLKISLTILDAINHLPLIKPMLELVGMVYTVWFAWRYLRSGSKRQELSEAIQSVRQSLLERNNA